MKKKVYLLLIFAYLGLACTSDDILSAPELETKIEQLENEIKGLIEASTGESSNDCRTAYIDGGDGCGPVYIYGIKGIDTVNLERLFHKLGKTKTALFNLQGLNICRIAIPSKDSLIAGTCRGCFETEGEGIYECF